MRADERSYTLHNAWTAWPRNKRGSFVYPRLFALHKLPPSQTPFQFPPPLNLSAESISERRHPGLPDDSLADGLGRRGV